MLLTFALAFADDPTSLVDAPPPAPAAVPAPPPEPAPAAAPAPTGGDVTVATVEKNPLAMKLTGFVDAPAELHLGKGPATVRHFQVVDHAGPLSVAEIAARVGDPAVQARRKKEVTVASVIGGLGLATAASMLAAHSVESINNDPTLEPVTAITGVLGFVVGVGAFGGALQGNQRPWVYWTPEELQAKVDAANAALPAVR